MTTTETETLIDLAHNIRQAYPRESPERLDKLLWDAICERPDALDLLRPACTHYVHKVLRAEVRRAEQRVYNAGTDSVARSAVTDLLDRGFFVGGRWVVWRNATQDDLTERIREYDDQITELGAARAVYAAALAEMKAAGAKRYGDLFKTGRRK